MSFPFNVRVYGALVLKDHLLLSSESYKGIEFTKLPGGGLEFGEGLRAALEREFREEINLPVQILDHIYTTDFFQPSAFDHRHQVISVYYRVGLAHEALTQLNGPDREGENESEAPPHIVSVEGLHQFSWVPLSDLRPSHFTFPIDKHVVHLLKKLPSVGEQPL